MLAEGHLVQCLREAIGRLLGRGHSFQDNVAIGDKGTEEVVLGVDVLRSWTHRWCLGHGQSSAIVLEESTSHIWLGTSDVVSQILHLLDHLHNRDGLSQSLTQADVLALCGTEGDLGLKLGLPHEWASHKEDGIP